MLVVSRDSKVIERHKSPFRFLVIRTNEGIREVCGETQFLVNAKKIADQHSGDEPTIYDLKRMVIVDALYEKELSHEDILSATNASVISGMIGEKYIPLPGVTLEEMLLANRCAVRERINPDGSRTITCCSDPRILALLYAYEQYGSNVEELLVTLAEHVPGSCARLMAGATHED